MPINLSQPLVEEKNKIEQTSPWLLCLQMVNVAGDLTIRVVNNTEDVTFKGELYQAFPFEIDTIPEATKGSLPTVAIKLSNVDRTIQAYVEQDATFGSGWTVTLFLVHADHLADTSPEGQVSEIEQTWQSLDVTASAETITINLGMANPMLVQFPSQKFSGGFCQRVFKQHPGCPYTATVTNSVRLYNEDVTMSPFTYSDSNIITVTASSNSTDAYKAFNFGGSAWISEGDSDTPAPDGQYIMWEYSVGTIINTIETLYYNGYRFIAGTPDSHGAYPRVYTIQGSFNGTTWDTLGINNSTESLQVNSFTNTNAYTYYRLYFPSTKESIGSYHSFLMASIRAYSGDVVEFTTCKKTIAQCKERFPNPRFNYRGQKMGLPFLGFLGMEVRAIYES